MSGTRTATEKTGLGDSSERRDGSLTLTITPLPARSLDSMYTCNDRHVTASDEIDWMDWEPHTDAKFCDRCKTYSCLSRASGAQK